MMSILIKNFLGHIKDDIASKTKSQEVVHMDNRSLSHTKCKCQYHIVFIPKYRKRVLYDKVRDEVREILNE